MKYLGKSFLFFSLVFPIYSSAVSMVYNFRVAQITKEPISESSDRKKYMIVALLFDQFRKKKNGPFQNYLGGLGSFIYNFDPYYFRTDFAVSNVQESIHGETTFSGVQTDDILFTFGRNFIISDRSVKTLSVLFGVPTHQINRLRHIDFGYNQVGLGAQLDGSYAIKKSKAILYGARYIYFVPRKARDPFDQVHTFTLGNIGDLLLAYQDSWKHHGWEFGYTFRSRFGANASPSFNDIEQRTDYNRSNFYGVYKYKFLTENTAQRILLYVSYGFDHTPKHFGNKYIVTFWGSWNIEF